MGAGGAAGQAGIAEGGVRGRGARGRSARARGARGRGSAGRRGGRAARQGAEPDSSGVGDSVGMGAGGAAGQAGVAEGGVRGRGARGRSARARGARGRGSAGRRGGRAAQQGAEQDSRGVGDSVGMGASGDLSAGVVFPDSLQPGRAVPTGAATTPT
ncbi:hypothetical protein PR002_g32250, partial [Phytophthora rubi]